MRLGNHFFTTGKTKNLFKNNFRQFFSEMSRSAKPKRLQLAKVLSQNEISYKSERSKWKFRQKRHSRKKAEKRIFHNT